jgi:Ca2+-binding EF-hand superfamily protein
MTLELETGFTKSSIRRLESRFLSLDKDHKGYLERRDLMVIPEVWKKSRHLLFESVNIVIGLKNF